MDIPAGRAFGPYEIIAPLGHGGMGTVYLARDTRLDRRVAMKFVNADGQTPEATQRLRAEARIASTLNHPNICQIYDVGSDGPASWIAMEYVEGRPLSASIPPGGRPATEVVRIVKEIASALRHAHARGVIHRDLKPANIVCDAGGTSKVLDFGISSRLPEAMAHDATRTGVPTLSPGIEGSLPYMAPETLRGEPPDPRADLWSLGVLAYELLTGARPFRGDDALELAASVLDARVPPLPAGTPAPLDRVIARLLARDPHERYRDASEVLAALDAASVVAPRRGVLLATIVAVLVCAAAGGYFVWTTLRPTPLSLTAQRLISDAAAPHRAPSFSPDGTMMAAVVPDGTGIPQIRVLNVAQKTSISVTQANRAAGRPRWSPKGDQIVYSAEGDGIWSVSPLGGEPRRILPRGANPNFSRDGTRLVFEDASGIWTAAADGTNLQKVAGTGPLQYRLPRGPAFSPDGSQIAFFQTELGPNGDIWVIPSQGGTPRRLTFDMREGGWPVWTRDGRTVIFSSARGGSRTLWQVAAEGGEPVPLTVGAGEDDQPDLSADGREITYTNVRNTWDLRVRNLATGVESSLMRRGTEMQFPMFSPDGSRLTFFGRSDYAVAIFTINADGTGLRQLTAGRELNHQPRWGPGGDHLYFYQSLPEPSLRRISALGGASVKFRDWDWMRENAPHFDPTGRYVLYLRVPSPGTSPATPEQTVLHTIATGEERTWPAPHTHPAGWSREGESIVGWQHDAGIVICRVADSDCRGVAKGVAPVWPPDSTRIYFLRPENPVGPQQLWSVNVDGTGERYEATLGTFRALDRFFTVSRQGIAAWAAFQPGSHEIWTAQVK